MVRAGGVVWPDDGIRGHGHGRTINGGVPLVSMLISDAQRVVFGGQPSMNTIVTQGVPVSPPTNLRALTTAAVQSDTLRPLRTPISSLNKSMEMMWVIAAVI